MQLRLARPHARGEDHRLRALQLPQRVALEGPPGPDLDPQPIELARKIGHGARVVRLAGDPARQAELPPDLPLRLEQYDALAGLTQHARRLEPGRPAANHRHPAAPASERSMQA